MKHRYVVLAFLALTAGVVWTFAVGTAYAQTSGLTLSATSLPFSATVNGSRPPSQTLTVSASRSTSFTASASVQSGGRNWLTISPTGSLTTNRTLTVSVNQQNLAAGTYAGTISIVSRSGTRTVAISLVVTASTGGAITVSPTSLTFNATAGGSAPASQSVTVSASSATAFTASSGAAWLAISPSGSLTTNRTITVSANPSGLAAGTYNGSISLVSGGTTRTVAVSLVVSAATASITVSPTSLAFNATAGGSAPASQSVTVSASSATAFTASSGAAWLAISPSGSLTTNRTLTASASPTGLTAGTYNGTISIVSNGTTKTVAVTFAIASSGGGGATDFKLIGWNDLGMHCMDGKDYSIFGVLPPYNTIHVHLLDANGNLITAPGSYTVTYQAVTDPLTGTINTTSAAKTNFWQFAAALGFGSLAPDVGLKGSAMPGTLNTPQSMTFSATDNTWVATGIPILPYADAPAPPYPVNYYPMMRLTARDTSGNPLATTDIVLPISDEMTCKNCHASNSDAAAQPAAGWVLNTDPAKDVKLNILRKHDDRFKTTALFQSAATAVGYSTAGLETTTATKPVLCDSCHGSNALSMAGVTGVPALTTSMHSLHSTVVDPATNQTLNASTTRQSCYNCHPGPTTQCLRGAMGTLQAPTGGNAIECQSCHGSMSNMAVATRKGWFDEPNCQACHSGTATSNAGQIVYTSVFSSGTTIRVAPDQTFATTPNTPSAGISLYRFSAGHGGLQCEACHGSTHAEYPTPNVNDNVQSNALQGHSGMLSECTACHATVPSTTTGGPHGLHPIGTTWVSRHQDVAGSGGATACQVCHGTDYRGTVLSRIQADRTLAGHTFTKGTIIGCYSCHNGPNGG